MPNTMLTIAPYRHNGVWAFDEPAKELEAEPFVGDINTMIDRLIKDAGIENAEAGFRLMFSANPFPGHSVKLDWIEPEMGGNWYHCEAYGLDGWLCPALFKFFDEAPKAIYTKAEPLG